MSEASPANSATRTLHGLVVASLAAPVLMIAIGSYLAWQSTLADAHDMVRRTVAIATEQATKVLDTHMLVADRVNDLLGQLDDAQIIVQEATLRDAIRAMTRRLPQVSDVVVVAADGQLLLAASQYPVDHATILDLPHVVRALQDLRQPFHVGLLAEDPIEHRPAFTFARRLGDDPARFRGYVLVEASPHYFEAFHQELFDHSRDYSAALYRQDGMRLARYAEAPPIRSGDDVGILLLKAVVRNPVAGLLRGATSDSDAEWLFAYRKVESYPVYATATRPWISIRRAWLERVAWYLAVGIPAMLALFALSLTATRRARRESTVLNTLRQEVRRREAAEETLRQAQKMEAVGRLTRGIAHDFNNHLTAISSNIELLMRRLPAGSDALLRRADAAMQGVRRAATLTHRLLAFSRQQPLDPEPLNVGRLVAGMSDLLRRTLGESIAIETVLPGGLWLTRADANQLEAALLHLAVNAHEAMPDGGKLTIETANTHLDETYAAGHPDATAGAYVMLAVTDTGTGMSRETLGRVFDPFFTTKFGSEASGLGLAMVYSFVTQSRGHIRLQSEPGEGTTVRIYLPRYLAQPVAAAVAAQPGPIPARDAGETILVVEDDEDVRRSSVEALRDLGYVVLEAPDAMEAFRLIADRGGIDLLFTDVGLPGGVNGQALADAARNVCPELRVLFTTGYNLSAALQDQQAATQGMHFLAKPFTFDELAAKVRECLSDAGVLEVDAAPPG